LKLEALQRWFAEVITHPEGLAVGLDSSRSTGDGAHSVDRVVLPSRRLEPRERVGIYHDAYRHRLIECLADDYPALSYALGNDAFSELALAYIAAYPSRSPNLNFYGRHLAAFCLAPAAMAAQKEVSRDRRGDLDASSLARFAADLAELEWALVEVLHAPSGERLSTESLARIAPDQWPRATFVVSPTLRVVSTRYPVNAFYQAWRQDEAPCGAAEKPSATAVFRDGATLWRMDLARPMELLLRALAAGKTLGSAFAELEGCATLGDDAGPQVMASFREWVGHGFFATVALASEADPAPA